MLSAERRQFIADLIRKQSSVRVRDLCVRFNASESTIRRDLEYLERQGILQRMYGGATAVGGAVTGEQSLHDSPPSADKMRIGAATTDLVAKGETVFIGPGTTALAVAYHIASKPGVTVVTNALNVAVHLTQHSQLPVILTGGQVERRETALSGHLAELTFRELRADRAIIDVHGIQIPDGVTAGSLSSAQFLRTLVGLLPQITVVATADKWARVGPAFLAPLEAIDTIVTGLDAPPAMVWDLTELGIKVIQT
jgi:DeoR family transcriptional regulator, fructose operon transcriptional repressor